MLHGLSHRLTGRRQLAHEILFHHQSAYRHTEVSTPSAVLHIHGNGYPGLVHRCKAHEYGVVAAVVLRRTGLAARLKRQSRQGTTCSLQSRRAHACHHIVVRTVVGLGEVAVCERCVERHVLHLAHYVRGVVVAAVGYRSAEISYLQRRQRYLSLSYRD